MPYPESRWVTRAGVAPPEHRRDSSAPPSGEEADGSTILDNSLVVWLSEISEGGHGVSNAKWVVAGGAGGRLKTCRFVTFGDPNRGQWQPDKSQPSHGDFWLTIARALDVPLTSFGEARALKGPIASLLNA